MKKTPSLLAILFATLLASSCDQLFSPAVTDPGFFTYIDTGPELVISGLTPEGEALSYINIPQSIDGKPVRRLGNFCFMACSSLVEVWIPDSVDAIGFETFRDLPALRTVHFGNGLRTIMVGAFRNCARLGDISLPDSIESIGGDAFRDCGSIAALRLGANLTFLGNRAFFDCGGLRTVTLKALIPPALGDNAFMRSPDASHPEPYILPGLTDIVVAEGKAGDYCSAANWIDYASRIR